LIYNEYFTSGMNVGSDGTIYVFGYEGICAFSEDGQMLWNKNLTIPNSFKPYDYFGQTPSMAITQDGTTLFFVGQPQTTTAYCYALDSQTGSQIWSYRLPSPLIYSSDVEIVVGPNGLVYLILNPIVYALDANEGTLKWTYNRDDGINFVVIGKDGTVFAAGDGVDAIDGVTGVLKWSSVMFDVLSMAITSDGKLVSLNTEKTQLLIIDGQTGALIATYDAESVKISNFNSLAIAPDGTVVVAGTQNSGSHLHLHNVAFFGRTSLPWVLISL